jgi:6-pyruvoyl-tetrahydropterin synthase
MIEVARVYRFRGRHHVPGLAGPWGTPHSHVYTIEVVARVDSVRSFVLLLADHDAPSRMIVDTAKIDEAWALEGLPDVPVTHDLDSIFGAERTTVEALAARWLVALQRHVGVVRRVVVREDDERWGAAER